MAGGGAAMLPSSPAQGWRDGGAARAEEDLLHLITAQHESHSWLKYKNGSSGQWTTAYVLLKNTIVV